MTAQTLQYAPPPRPAPLPAVLQAERAFAAGKRHHQAGQLRDAEACYRAALELDPHHTNTLHLLGVVLFQTGALDEAVRLIQRAIEAAPDQPSFHVNLSNALQALGRYADAAASCRTAIRLRPDLPEAHCNLGMALCEQGKLPEALESLRKSLVLRPGYAVAHINLGNVLQAMHRDEDAADYYRQALRCQPGFAEAHINLGILLGRTSPDEAVAHLRTATALQPQTPTTHYELGRLLAKAGQWQEAVAAFRTAIALKPGYADALVELGNAYLKQTMFEEAVVTYGVALRVSPGFAGLHNNIATALSEMDRHEEAAEHFAAAARLDSTLPGVNNNTGITLQSLGKFPEARDAYRRAIAISPDYADAHLNLGMTLLALGEMEEGWKEYEWRWRSESHAKRYKTYPQPQWMGEPAAGKTLLIHVEQGFGDTLQFCRYAPLVAERGITIVMAVQAQLLRLLQGMPGVAKFVTPGETLPRVDLQCPLLSLPLALGTTVATIPATVPYLHAQPDLTALWGQRLAAVSRRRWRVGLVWEGGSHGNSYREQVSNRRRSLTPDMLAPLFDAKVDFISLQIGGSPMPPHLPLIDLTCQVKDFADTSALIANLDLVISVDTAVLHLAAGMGKPVWMLDRLGHCWRWLAGRTDSPWYPSLRIYRQQSRGDWGSVIAAAAADLRALAGAG